MRLSTALAPLLYLFFCGAPASHIYTSAAPAAAPAAAAAAAAAAAPPAAPAAPANAAGVVPLPEDDGVAGNVTNSWKTALRKVREKKRRDGGGGVTSRTNSGRKRNRTVSNAGRVDCKVQLEPALCLDLVEKEW